MSLQKNNSQRHHCQNLQTLRYLVQHIHWSPKQLYSCLSIAKAIDRSRSQDQHSQVRSMFHAHLDVLATHIPPGQIMGHTRNPTGAAPMKHPRNPIETVMKPFSPGKILTKNTANRDTLWDRRMDNLLIRTNRQIELNTAYNRYYCTKEQQQQQPTYLNVNCKPTILQYPVKLAKKPYINL